VLRDGWFTDLELTARFRFVQDHRAAGVVFRVTGAAVGFDAQHGYFAGIARDRDALVLGKTDGVRFTSLAEVPIAVDVSAEQTITVTAAGDSLRVSCADTGIDVHDSSYTAGSIGLRVVDTHTCFTELSVQPAS
jgi:hypothetical protein